MPDLEDANTPGEVVKRLTPTTETVRTLYLLSGNRCAFDPCDQAIVNRNGRYVGQICHIEGAMPDGERFNKKMTNEQRRHISNLLLLCYEHHVETNDEREWNVERMLRMKHEHERRFQAGFNELVQSVCDWTQFTSITPPLHANSYNSHCGWTEQFSPEEVNGNVATIVSLAERLRNLSLDAREYLYNVVWRGRPTYGGVGIETAILANVMRLNFEQAQSFCAELVAQDLAWLPDDFITADDFKGPHVIAL